MFFNQLNNLNNPQIKDQIRTICNEKYRNLKRSFRKEVIKICILFAMATRLLHGMQCFSLNNNLFVTKHVYYSGTGSGNK